LNKNKNILICPLEWGLGHAARMIPIAKKLREMNYNVIIASGDDHLALFRNELSGLSYINFGGFKPGYSRYLPQYLHLLFKIPELIYYIISDHHKLKKIIADYRIDIVISDNRFGLWNKNVTSVYVTHMPLIPLPKPLKFLEPVGVYLHRKIIEKYNFCLIPDLPGDINLTGRLSHGIKLPGNVRFVGILSRFNDTELASRDPLKLTHNTVILSGPEPQREILKQKLIHILKDKYPTTIMLEGKPAQRGEIEKIGNIAFYNHLPASRMRGIIEDSEIIISRSGYTTIMELISLKCTALIIPTPGQTEQEYLAEYLSQKGWFTTISQNEINEGISLIPGKMKWENEFNRESNLLLGEVLMELSEENHKQGQSKKTCK
jgi:UDP-N-acetylglucosamine transferase subunit ALG13